MGKDKTKDGETTASETQVGHRDAQRDHSQEQEARDATLVQTIAEAVAREMAKAHVHYQAILNERGATTLPTSLKISSGSHGFKVMDPFNWTKDKSIYQRWQIWSEKARLTLDAMEGDSEKTKISYFHHWINGEGMGHIESWKNSKTLISQSAYDELESKQGKYSSECIESYFTLFELFPKVKLSVCPHEIQNFGNSVADISILGQFCTYLQFRGEKYLNTFIVTNANDCPNLLSHGATFRMGVLLPNYPEENVVKSCGENVPNFKCNTSTGTSTGTSSNVFQILQDLRLKQYQENHPDSLQNESRTSHTSTHSTTGTLIQNIAQLTTSFRTITPTKDTTGRMNTVQLTTSFRTTTPTKATTGEQVNPVQVSQDTSCNTHLESCMHVHQPMSQVCKPGESLALRKVKHPLNGSTSVSRLPLTKQDILSQYSGCFEGIGHFPGDLYKFHLKPDHKPA